MPSQQFAFNTNDGFAVVDKDGEYKKQDLELNSEVKSFKYSPLGDYLVIIQPKSLVLFKSRSEKVQLEQFRSLDISNVLDFSFSPKESFITVVSRYVKPADNDVATKNLRVFNVESGEEVMSFTQKNTGDWRIEWTEDEAYCAKQVSNEVQLFDSRNFGKGIFSRVKIEGIQSFSLSPGKRPVLGVFVSGKGGAPSSARLYDLANLDSPLTQKSFFRADSVTFHWNNLGTNVLVFTHTDVDATGKSYYGETSLYFLSITGNFDCRVELSQAGPIHDVAWSPNAKEFIVVYGSMPARATLFDHRAAPMYELGTGARNTIKYSPSGRFFFIAGFGNLAGELDVWERKSFKKVASIAASNSSTCEWSPDGRHILTGTLYRRLKVDNGIKIWHYSGVLAHQIESKEMYQVAWRPDAADLWPERSASSPVPSGIKPASPAKPAGKYVPPGARNSPHSSQTIYDRDAIDRGLSSSKSNVSGKKTHQQQRKQPTPGKNAIEIKAPPPVIAGAVPGGQLEIEKKIKNITKKLKQIDDLRMKQATGEQLELTQISKIASEVGLLEELAKLQLQTS